MSGYCGDVLGYLPLPEQAPEGEYEGAQFQPLFGFEGHFHKDALLPKTPKREQF
jgi:hypothetical protein